MSICRTAMSSALILIGTLGGRPASATPISYYYSGSLSSQAQVVEKTFAVTSRSIFFAQTNSYAGGLNGNGTTTVAGGFQPSLILFDGAGSYVGGQEALVVGLNKDPVSGLALDSFLGIYVGPGTYSLTLTDWLNQQSPTATNLSDGFTFNLGSGGFSFIDEASTARTSNYSLNVTIVPQDFVTPEPSTAFLFLPAGAGLFFYVRKRRTAIP